MMSALRRPGLWILLGVGLVILVFGQQFWQWVVERVEVQPGKFLVLTHRWGKDLPPDMILAPDDSYKGVLLDVKPEGRHFINPILYSHEVADMVTVPPGKCLVLTRKYGSEIPKERLARGEILARGSFEAKEREDVERGILRDPLGPGSYRINPHAYVHQTVDAVEVKTDQVGVRTLKIGKDPGQLAPDPAWGHYVVPGGFRGVQMDPVPPGTYYLNPFVETITPVEVRSHRVELSDIEFPSRDGFILKPHVLVEYAVQPRKAPEVLIRLTDEGQLHQEDSTAAQQAANEILQKIILPHMRGYARLEGSNFDARDFIISTPGVGDQKVVNNREKLQQTLFTKVKPRCEEVGIEIRAVTLAELVPPVELSKQISERELARVEQEKNKVRLGELKAAQKLKAAETLKQQAREKVEAETRLVQAKTNASQRKEVMEAQLKQDLENAQLRLDAARKQAEATLLNGKAEAAVINLKNEAEVAGLRKAIQGFSNAGLFAQYHVLMRLAPALSEVFASDESDFAKMFSGYMTQGPGTPGTPATTAKPLAPMQPATGASGTSGR
jgi:regulator of protease activity HflC (stomatin/prohibitin superfamily)